MYFNRFPGTLPSLKLFIFSDNNLILRLGSGDSGIISGTPRSSMLGSGESFTRMALARVSRLSPLLYCK